MYNIKDDIALPNHNYSTRLKFMTNVIDPKMRTVFGQQCLKYKFIQFCCDHDLNNKYKPFRKFFNL